VLAPAGEISCGVGVVKPEVRTAQCKANDGMHRLDGSVRVIWHSRMYVGISGVRMRQTVKAAQVLILGYPTPAAISVHTTPL
jgi:hypothetical protein